jgi:antitoxin (DNA-binding transcriptional repressor) of toxin-antitoxin stability system
MVAVSIKDLKERTEALLRLVQESGETLEILVDGEVVARLVPTDEPPPTRAELDAFWADLDELAEEIGANWPEGVSAVDAVNDVRRDL